MPVTTPGGSNDLTPQAAATVLVIDDNFEVRALVARALEREGFRVYEAADTTSASSRLHSERPDLVLLDIGLPGTDGLELLREIRRTSDIPVILITGRAEETDRVVGLELGADDYVVKPFFPRELAARVRSLLRRARNEPRSTRLEFGRLVIDLGTREVFVNGIPVDLPQREFDLLAFLASSPRQVFSRERILREVWKSSEAWQQPATVTEHVRRVRSKIETDPDAPGFIQTVRGVGYRFQPDAP